LIFGQNWLKLFVTWWHLIRLLFWPNCGAPFWPLSATFVSANNHIKKEKIIYISDGAEFKNIFKSPVLTGKFPNYEILKKNVPNISITILQKKNKMSSNTGYM